MGIIMVWFVLASSLATLATHRLIAIFLLLFSTTLAFFTGILSWPAILLLVGIAIVGFIRLRFENHLAVKILSEIILVSCAIGLFTHLALMNSLISSKIWGYWPIVSSIC